MVVGHFARDRILKTHPQEGIGNTAEGLPVKEVAPTANGLSDENIRQYGVDQMYE